MSKLVRATNVMALGLVLVCFPACEKSKTGTTNPTQANGGTSTAAGMTLRYANEGKLRQTTEYSFTFSGGGQFGELNASFVALLELQPNDGDDVRVAWKIDDVKNLELKGALKPEAKPGEPVPPDPKTVLKEHGHGGWVMDARGETNTDASKALPVNADRIKARAARAERAKARDGKDKAPDGQAAPVDEQAAKDAAETLVDTMVQFIAAALDMPSMPEQPLEIGKPVKIEKEEDADFGGSGIKIPMESETTYTLVKIDESSGRKIAEIAVESEASGATETQNGMLVIDQASDGTVMFDIEKQIPLGVDLQSAQTFAFGDNATEITVMVKSRFELL